MRQWINQHKSELSERLQKEVPPETSEAEVETRLNSELSQTFDKIVEKALFLIQMKVPEAFLVKDQSKEKGTLLLIKEAMGEAMSKQGTSEGKEIDWKNRMKTWRTMMTSKGAIKSFTEKKKEIFESSVMSILAYLQAPISLD